MVRTQAQAIRAVTPQRTAETRWLEPTPMIAPLITCVVETGRPRCEAARIVTAALGLGREAVDRLQVDDLRAHRLDDPHAAGHRPEAHRRRRRRR